MFPLLWYWVILTKGQIQLQDAKDRESAEQTRVDRLQEQLAILCVLSATSSLMLSAAER